jgi:hypothetical protein
MSRRVALLGVTLLLFLGACDSHRPYERRLEDPSKIIITIETPRYAGQYPSGERIPIVVTIRNEGDMRRTLDITSEPRRLGCNPQVPIPKQRESVELLFAGIGFPPSAESVQPYVWHWQPSTPPPRRLVLEPGQNVVLVDTVFAPPADYSSISGNVCARVFGWEIPARIGFRPPRY